jgi:membrane carboxypeptidase/penicillin-binding protein
MARRPGNAGPPSAWRVHPHPAARRTSTPSSDRSLLRKGKELLLAHRLEAHLSKQRVLALYLYVVEWGEGV